MGKRLPISAPTPAPSPQKQPPKRLKKSFVPLSSPREFLALSLAIDQASEIVALCGPTGCGKSHSVVALTKEKGFFLSRFDPIREGMRQQLFEASRRVVGQKRLALIDDFDGYMPKAREEIIDFLLHRWKSKTFSQVVLTTSSAQALAPLRGRVRILTIDTPSPEQLLTLVVDGKKEHLREVAERVRGDIRQFMVQATSTSSYSDATRGLFDVARMCLERGDRAVVEAAVARLDSSSLERLVQHNIPLASDNIEDIADSLDAFSSALDDSFVRDDVQSSISESIVSRAASVTDRAPVIRPFPRRPVGRVDVDSVEFRLGGPRPPPISWDRAEI
tara:strand:- start:152 stop:1150 length:999 start_codon:yes stop_codon:yes gene_type:complete